jgi:hypothetical protein
MTERMKTAQLIRFKLCGAEGLRIAGLSVLSHFESNHAQVNASVIGQLAVREMIKENGGFEI